MLRPIAAVSPCVLNRIAAVNHHIITDVNPHMAHRPRGVISAGKENDVAGFGLRHWDILYDKHGQPHVCIDEYMKRHLEIKLISSIVTRAETV